MVHPHNGILLSSKKQRAIKPRRDKEALKHTLLSEGSRLAQATNYHMMPTIRHPGKAKLQRRNHQWLPGDKEGRAGGEVEGGGLLGQGKLLCTIVKGGYVTLYISPKPWNTTQRLKV